MIITLIKYTKNKKIVNSDLVEVLLPLHYQVLDLIYVNPLLV